MRQEQKGMGEHGNKGAVERDPVCLLYTSSVASVGLKQLSQLNTPNVTSMLQNLAAGVQVSQNTGVPGETDVYKRQDKHGFHTNTV